MPLANHEVSPSRPRTADAAESIPNDCRGQNFWRLDPSLRQLLALCADTEELRHFTPHFDRLGELAGNTLDELADAADKHPPTLAPRDRHGRDVDRIDYHPAYREMERIAFSEFGMAAIGHKPGVLGWPGHASPLVKYTLTYLFSQAEFGLLCPVNGNDAAVGMIQRYADDTLKQRMAGMLSQDMRTLLKIGHFMTERTGGSDLAGIGTHARFDGSAWKIYGEKWFYSAIDADYVLVLARPEGAPAGTRGLGMFVVPRLLEDGTRNRYRIARLKNKLGTRSMATGEVVFDGALAHAIGQGRDGIRYAVLPINASRLSHGVRAAGIMRRCLNESLHFARRRAAFGKPVIAHPLMKRSLLKIMVPTEQALSACMFVASTMHRAGADDPRDRKIVRLATALLKFRACRDNATVATAAMEVRGGSGYIEEWINARLVRDAQTGLLWEGTSNINALDIVTRAVARDAAHEALRQRLMELARDARVPPRHGAALTQAVEEAVARIAAIAADPQLEHLARSASSRLYHVMTAVLLAHEGAMLAARTGDARRLLLSWMVLMHRIEHAEPFDGEHARRESRAADLLLDVDRPVTLEALHAVTGMLDANAA
ncbi:acyl-CoA dehydrogenase [Bordetella pertussis]|uniref:DNA alkylation response protein n=1 Tax=Bordetella pertussis TaxID=520 RepID=UPI0005E44F51|nr:DNA alkylation response protein [Bordetella pertussis]CPJ80433.1 acyl-CoA dehydrogenase [Bordetella pertussis]